MADIFKKGLSFIISYETPKVVRIKSVILGTINRVVQLAVILYIVIWVLIIRKGYQQTDRGYNSVTTRVTGIAYPRSDYVDKDITQHIRVWDVVDTVVPAEVNKAFFVTTSAVVAEKQTRSVCAEDSSVKEAHCLTNDDCLPVESAFPNGHGVSTGTCNNDTKTCNIEAWCPVEKKSNLIQLDGFKNFTVLVKSHVVFPLLSATRVSNVAGLNSTYIENCRYNSTTDPHCPMFNLQDIVDGALAKDFSHPTFDEVVVEGAVIAIRVNWYCNLDFDVKYCFPNYAFDRLDTNNMQGYSYSYAHKYTDNSIDYRQLITAKGLLFVIIADAEAGKFDPLPTALNIGAGLALLGAATTICDFLLLYCNTKRNRLRHRGWKYTDISGHDAYGQGRGYNMTEPIGLDINFDE